MGMCMFCPCKQQQKPTSRCQHSNVSPTQEIYWGMRVTLLMEHCGATNFGARLLAPHGRVPSDLSKQVAPYLQCRQTNRHACPCNAFCCAASAATGMNHNMILTTDFAADLHCRTFNNIVGDYYVAPSFLQKVAVSLSALTLRPPSSPLPLPLPCLLLYLPMPLQHVPMQHHTPCPLVLPALGLRFQATWPLCSRSMHYFILLEELCACCMQYVTLL